MRFSLYDDRQSELNGFVALRAKKKSEALDTLAADCVRDFDHFRKPPTAAELAKRNAANLTDIQMQMLERWGYSYVMDEFRFHMTLTDGLADEERKVVLAALVPHVQNILSKPVKIDVLTLMKQKNDKAPI